MLVDGKELIFAGMEDGDWQAIRTQSPPLVTFFLEFFFHDIALTKITQRYHDIVMKDEEIRDMLLKLRY